MIVYDVCLIVRIVDSLQECCHCNDSNVCVTSVSLVNDLVTSLDKLCHGHGLSDDIVVQLHKLCSEVDGKLLVYVNAGNMLTNQM